MASENEVMQVSSDTDPEDIADERENNLSQDGVVTVDSDGDLLSGEDQSYSEESDESESDGDESDDEDSDDDEDDVSDEDESSETKTTEDNKDKEEDSDQSNSNQADPKVVSASDGSITVRVAAESTSEPEVSTTHPFQSHVVVSQNSASSSKDNVEKNGVDSSINIESQSESKDNEKPDEAGAKQNEKKAKKPRKRKAKPKSGEDGQPEKAKKKSKEEKEKRGKKRKRKEKKEKEEGEKKRKTTFERRNIRKIIKDQALDEETIRAQREEMERKKRVAEKMERLKASQLQSLLDDDSMSDGEPPPPKPIPKPKKKDDVVEISSDEDEDVAKKEPEPEEADEVDTDNSGSHVNDAMNQPDVQGRVLVNVGHPPKEPDIFLPPQLAANVKPHQIGGIRFLYDNVVESLDQYKTGNGLGCILAHSMGLGKTLQVISFSDCFLRYTSGKRVLIIVPVNTLQNWMSEFNMWLPDKATLIQHYKRHREAQRKAEEEAAKMQEPEFKMMPEVEMDQPDSTTDLKADFDANGEFANLSGEVKSEMEEITFDTTDFGVDTSGAASAVNDFAAMEALAEMKMDSFVPQLDGQSDPKPDQVSSTTLPPPPPMNIPQQSYSSSPMPPNYVNNSASNEAWNQNIYQHMKTEVSSVPPMPQHMMWQNHQSMSPGTSSQSSNMPVKTEQSSHSFSHNMNMPIPTPASSGRATPKNSTPTKGLSTKGDNSRDSFKLESEDSKHSTDSTFKKPKDECTKAEVKDEDLEDIPDSVFKDAWPREFQVYLVNDSYKTNAARAKTVAKWFKDGGVMLMGYEMYRLLTSKKVISKPKKTKSQLAREKESGTTESVTIDLVEEEKNSELMAGLQDALVNPGPDLIICDEGHRIKNSHAGISQSLKNIKTRRRVVLTGYPLQNNLLEYWCMVDFVRPNFLGTKTEFCNMFERPIMNGQCQDSTPQDVRLMRFRAHVLHSLLEGFVQRRSAEVLRTALPPKEESVLLVKMSPIQRRLYKAFMDIMGDVTVAAWANANPLKAFSVCCKIWNHPDILNQIIEQRKLEDNDLDIEDKDDVGGAKGKKGRGSMKKSASSTSTSSMESMLGRNQDQVITYDWAEDIMKDYEPGRLENGGKMLILFGIVQQSIALGEKILVFSQSLFTLSLIENYLSKMNVPWPEGNQEKWAKNKNYYRLDGSTSSTEREKLINFFNSEANNSVHLFLLSTRAGCLGINLIGANRVVIFDASWNPCHDCQAVCRVYRYGQQRSCYVYRLVTDNTMEKKIYDRQISKQGISDRVVDELNPNQHMTRKQVDVLLEYDDIDPPEITPETAETYPGDDLVLYNMLSEHYKWITKVPFSHDALLSHNKEMALTKSEKKLARQGYEMEKKLSIGYSRPSYQAFYPKAAGAMDMSRFKQRPVASVRPMIMGRPPPMMSTPIPMQVMGARAAPQHRPGNNPALLKPGVSVQQIKLTSDIPIPGATQGITRIPAGETVLVIRTPKGVYIRTPQGKIFAVRSTPKGTDVSGGTTSSSAAGSADGKGGAEDRPSTSGEEKEGEKDKDLSKLATSKPRIITVTRSEPFNTDNPNKSPKPTPKIIVTPKAAGEMPKGTIVNIVPRVTKASSGNAPSIIQLKPSIGNKTQPSLFPPGKVVNISRGAPGSKPKTIIVNRGPVSSGAPRIITVAKPTDASASTITTPTTTPSSPAGKPSKKSNKEIVEEMLQKLEKGKKEDALKARREETARRQREEREKRQRELLLEMEKDPNQPALSPTPGLMHDSEDSSDSVEEWMEDQLKKMREQQAFKNAAGKPANVANTPSGSKPALAETNIASTIIKTVPTPNIASTTVKPRFNPPNAANAKTIPNPQNLTNMLGQNKNKGQGILNEGINKSFDPSGLHINSDTSDSDEEFERLYQESLCLSAMESAVNLQNKGNQSMVQNKNDPSATWKQHSQPATKPPVGREPSVTQMSNTDPMARPNPRNSNNDPMGRPNPRASNNDPMARPNPKAQLPQKPPVIIPPALTARDQNKVATSGPNPAGQPKQPSQPLQPRGETSSAIPETPSISHETFDSKSASASRNDASHTSTQPKSAPQGDIQPSVPSFAASMGSPKFSAPFFPFKKIDSPQAPPVFEEKKKKAPRAPKDPNAPPKERKKREPKDPNAPRKKPGPRAKNSQDANVAVSNDTLNSDGTVSQQGAAPPGYMPGAGNMPAIGTPNPNMPQTMPSMSQGNVPIPHQNPAGIGVMNLGGQMPMQNSTLQDPNASTAPQGNPPVAEKKKRAPRKPKDPNAPPRKSRAKAGKTEAAAVDANSVQGLPPIPQPNLNIPLVAGQNQQFPTGMMPQGLIENQQFPSGVSSQCAGQNQQYPAGSTAQDVGHNQQYPTGSTAQDVGHNQQYTGTMPPFGGHHPQFATESMSMNAGQNQQFTPGAPGASIPNMSYPQPNTAMPTQGPNAIGTGQPQPAPEKKKRAPRKPKDPNAPKKKQGPKAKNPPGDQSQNQNPQGDGFTQDTSNLANQNPITSITGVNAMQPVLAGQGDEMPHTEPPVKEKKKRAPRKPKDPNAPPKERKPRKKKGEQTQEESKDLPPSNLQSQSSTEQSMPSQTPNSATPNQPPMYQPWASMQPQNSANNQGNLYQPWNNQSYPMANDEQQNAYHQPWNNQPNSAGNAQASMYQPWNAGPNSAQQDAPNSALPPSSVDTSSTASSIINTTPAVSSATANKAPSATTTTKPATHDENAVISIEDLTKDNDDSLDNSDFFSSDSSEMMDFINESVKKYGHMHQSGNASSGTDTATSQSTPSAQAAGTGSTAQNNYPAPGMQGMYPSQNLGANQYGAWGMQNPMYPPQGYGDMSGYQNYAAYGGYQAAPGYWPPAPGQPPVTQPLVPSQMYGGAVKSEPGSAGTPGSTGAPPAATQAGWPPAHAMYSHYGMGGANPYYMNPGAPGTYPGQQQNYYGS